MSDPKYRPVNAALGMQPRLGPLPADQVIPWMMIAFVFYIVFQQVLHLSWLWTGILILWGCATWWLLTGSKAYRFLGKFIATPTWTRGRMSYRSLLLHIETMHQPQPRQTKRSKVKGKR